MKLFLSKVLEIADKILLIVVIVLLIRLIHLALSIIYDKNICNSYT